MSSKLWGPIKKFAKAICLHKNGHCDRFQSCSNWKPHRRSIQIGVWWLQQYESSNNSHLLLFSHKCLCVANARYDNNHLDFLSLHRRITFDFSFLFPLRAFLTGNFLFISPAASMDPRFHSPPDSSMSFLAMTTSCKRPRLCYPTARAHRRFDKMMCITSHTYRLCGSPLIPFIT